MAWGIFISFVTLFGTLVLVLVDATTAPGPSDSFGEMRETQQDGEEQDIRKAA